MDAISFVVGLRARHLRGKQLRDLVHRVGAAPPPASRQAYVKLVYEVDDDEIENLEKGDELVFCRTINGKGSSTYSVNSVNMSYDDYVEQLRSINVLVKARNFLVFQVNAAPSPT